MNKRLTLAGLGAALVGTLSLLPAAHAADGTGLQAGKARCNLATDTRHAALGALDQQVSAATTLSAAHRSAIEATVRATNAGLDGLKPAIRRPTGPR